MRYVSAALTDGKDSPVFLRESGALVVMVMGIRSFKCKESDMNATTVALDLAKSVF